MNVTGIVTGRRYYYYSARISLFLHEYQKIREHFALRGGGGIERTGCVTAAALRNTNQAGLAESHSSGIDRAWEWDTSTAGQYGGSFERGDRIEPY